MSELFDILCARGEGFTPSQRAAAVVAVMGLFAAALTAALIETL